MTTTLKRIGGSLAVIIPKALAEGMAAGDRLELTEKPEGILLSRPRRRPKRPIDQIVKNLDAKTYARRAKEFIGDGPVGREAW